jgi:alkyl hydroperoxide reductase subunit AhpC
VPVNVYAAGIGEKAPDFKVVTIEGKQVSYFQDLIGKSPVYLVFWATW